MATKINQKLYSADVADERRVEKAAAQLAHDSLNAAIARMNDLASSDKNKLIALVKQYRSGCSFAINNPEAFARQVLMADSKPTEAKPDLALGLKPLGIDSKQILARIKSGEYKVGKIGDDFCLPESEKVTVSLNSVLVENGKVCLEISKDSCSAKNNWLTYESYVQRLYPNHDVAKVSYANTFSMKNGETYNGKKIIACIT